MGSRANEGRATDRFDPPEATHRRRGKILRCISFLEGYWDCW